MVRIGIRISGVKISGLKWLVLIGFAARGLYAQAGNQGTAPGDQSPRAAVPQVAAPGLQVLYTGRLLGYFRAPDLQSGQQPNPDCASVHDTKTWSIAAQDFDKQRQTMKDAILVGTGDNFAPEIEARQFDQWHLPTQLATNGASAARGKDLYDWYPAELGRNSTQDGHVLTPNTWVPSAATHETSTFRRFESAGWGFVPEDNVACFLVAEGYSALVPGRHDFYFGPERLRQLARLLAKSQHTHMLGANLVIDTSWTADHKPLPDSAYKLNFVPNWPKHLIVQGQAAPVDAPTLLTPKQVYPWLAGATVKLKDLTQDGTLLTQLKSAAASGTLTPAQLERLLENSPCPAGESDCTIAAKQLKLVANAFNQLSVYLCDVARAGDPSSGPAWPGTILGVPTVKIEKRSVEYFYPFPVLSENANHLYQPYGLRPGANYDLCLDGPNLPPTKPLDKRYCQRFSVYWPLFASPTDRTQPGTWPAGQWPPFPEPAPYVLLEKSARQPVDVAIFGVVDPAIAQYVGVFNLDWENELSKSYVTKAAIEDPAEALRELVQFFELNYRNSHNNAAFSGVRILLAQMPPSEAQALAASLSELGFQAVVTAADSRLTTSDTALRVTWAPAPRGETSLPTMLVPRSVYDTEQPTETSVAIGSLTLTTGAAGTESQITAHRVKVPDGPALKAGQDILGSSLFSGGVTRALTACLNGRTPQGTIDQNVQMLTLCAMQKQTGADVVLMQQRDFFSYYPSSVTTEDTQSILDRVVWKGDLLVLRYVPGSVLQKVMQDSDQFAEQDKSALSIRDETARTLVTLGIEKHSDRNEYWINNVPLDPNRLYAVASSDYISAGDTGYPELAAAPLKAPQAPGDLPKQLEKISTAVCQMIQGAGSAACPGDIRRRDYFDEIAMSPTDTRQGDTQTHDLRAWLPFSSDHPVPAEAPAAGTGAKQTLGTSAAPALETLVQQRPVNSARINQPAISLLTIDNASVGFTSLEHRFTDAELKNLFPDTPVTQLSAPKGHTTTFDIRTKSYRTWNRVELFENTEMRYGSQYTAQTQTSNGLAVEAPTSIQQKDNYFASDTGFGVFFDRDRSLPHWEGLATFHWETQLTNPLPNVKQSLSLTGVTSPSGLPGIDRTHLLIPRLGLRRQQRISWFEAGLEDGWEVNAVRTMPSSTGSTPSLIERPNIPVSGVYWNWHVLVPIPHLAWTIDDDGDYFFNQHDDAVTDTRFRSDLKTQVNFQFQFLPSLSFAPTYEYFTYVNKVQGIWFWQGQASIQMKWRFDLWNKRNLGEQVKYMPLGK